jgi:uncharacterized lipoprotein YddW (UPF0748 family)/peptidoglycan/xylan/chitin deacetylase (PgdA/CDA1 family)
MDRAAPAITRLVILLLLAISAPALAQNDPPELRALWVDAFHEGIRSPREADDLVAAAKRANLNTLFVQVRRRGDALYTRGIEPPLDDPAYDPAFDALAYIVEAGHKNGLQIHAWVNAMPVWRDEAPPRDPRHVFNTHGPSASGDDNWLTAGPTGDRKFPVGYFLDPGHPAAAAYLAGIYLDIVRNYAVDGIHFDYVRYPETDERLPRGAGVGYNKVNLARFQRATGRTDIPQPADEAWTAWRRDQVTNLVRRVSIEARAINPRIKVSAALIAWGQPPASEKDFEAAAPMQRIFQDWHQWLKDGWLDLGVPMNYASEADDRVRGWFNGWMAWEKRHAHGRQLAVGLGAYRNTAPATLAQIARARAADAGHHVAGVSFFSYAVPTLPPATPPNAEPQPPVVPVTGADRLAFLADGAGGAPGAFTRPALVPPMPWIERPERGWIAGMLPGHDGAVVTITRMRWWPFGGSTRVYADGNGYFGAGNLKPGRYEVSVDAPGTRMNTVAVTVEPGKVSRANLDAVQRSEGGIIRGPLGKRQVALVFTAHEFAEGADTILDVLARRGAHASFFLTGAFLRDDSHAPLVRRMIANGHYVGPHSDGHLLYCPWSGPKVTLVSRDVFTADLQRNVDALARFGVAKDRIRFFLPPYEWYNDEIADWTATLGMTLVSYTPGTRSNADYTEEGTPQFVSSEAIYQSVLSREQADANGLNGFLLLLHAGAGPGRSDKFHVRFAELVDQLGRRGYQFVTVDALLAGRGTS